MEYLNKGKIDFGVVSAPVTENKGLRIIPVSKISDIFVANDRFSELKGKTIELQDLEKYPIICLEHNTSTRKYVDDFLRGNGAILNPEFELSTSELIVHFTTRSLGIGCVVRNFAEKLLADKTLFELQLKTPIPQRDICIVSYDKNPISPAGKKLLNTLVP